MNRESLYLNFSVIFEVRSKKEEVRTLCKARKELVNFLENIFHLVSVLLITGL